MNLVHRKVFWGRRKSRLGGEEAGSEYGQILLAEPQGHPRQQPRGHPLNPRRITGFLKGLHANKGPQSVIPLDETCQGFQQLVQEGKFLEAYLSVSASAWEGQDCGPQYQALAQSMWQVVQQALEGVRLGQELELKLQAVLDTVEYTQDKPPSPEAGTLEDGIVATWGSQLERLLRNDAEARVPTWDPRDKLGPFLEKLEEAVRQGLGSLRASQLGARLWTIYSTCFQEVLLSRLLELKHSCGASWNSCRVLYAWGRTTLFGQLGETLPNAPATSQKPTPGYLLDSMMFVTWMSQVQKKLVALIQERLEETLENVLICDQKKWAPFSHPTFLEIFQLLEEAIIAARPTGPSVTSQVQAMVLEIFSKFLNRYQDKAVHFLQQNATAEAFPEVHVLGNCCILRKTWQELSQACFPPADLVTAVQGAIHAIEGHSRDHLLLRVRALCQNLLRGHFGRKEKDLVNALQSLWQALEGCPSLHSTPVYESIMQSLHMVVFGEYVQALATHLRMLAPRKWGSLRIQVEMDIWKLDNIFRKHGGPGLAIPEEPILGIFQLSENKGRETVDDWLASFRDRFPGYLSMQDQPCSSVDSEVEVKGRSCCCCC
ncbi:uncharacterized protein LOC122469581 isoform X2 [Prionailurus bengalensis]|uniref:uncharacterized protein LOC122469581 isoform X2 n=1 Tax=Prionailurus bengalensis TaxID=37029 RepID=UPI001CA93C68|nr:uncharacterized protein LOC122469581 isoform X2 [Prionailurus bengalensis]